MDLLSNLGPLGAIINMLTPALNSGANTVRQKALQRTPQKTETFLPNKRDLLALGLITQFFPNASPQEIEALRQGVLAKTPYTAEAHSFLQGIPVSPLRREDQINTLLHDFGDKSSSSLGGYYLGQGGVKINPMNVANPHATFSGADLLRHEYLHALESQNFANPQGFGQTLKQYDPTFYNFAQRERHNANLPISDSEYFAMYGQTPQNPMNINPNLLQYYQNIYRLK